MAGRSTLSRIINSRLIIQGILNIDIFCISGRERYCSGESWGENVILTHWTI